MPHNVQSTKDGNLLLVTAMVMNGRLHHGSHYGHTGAVKGKLLVFDTKRMENPIANIEVGHHAAHGVVVSLHGDYAYIANSGEGAVSAINAETNKVVQTYKVGDGPNGITVR